MSQQNNQDIDKDSEDRISALEAAVWMHSKGKGQAHLIDAAKGRLRQYHHIYRKALADAIRNDDVRVIVIAGNGQHFSAGHDLKEGH